jgi:hypothetical protein
MNQIDLSGPKGNAFFLIGQAKMWAKELDLDADAISKEMRSSDYENLISVFNKYFSNICELTNSPLNERPLEEG